MSRCDAKTEVWARITGFFRPLSQWNAGKREEYRERVPYKNAPVRGGGMDRGAQ